VQRSEAAQRAQYRRLARGAGAGDRPLPGVAKRPYFRGDAAFRQSGNLRVSRSRAYRLHDPANSVLQRRIGHLLKRPIGWPPHKVRRYTPVLAIGHRAGANRARRGQGRIASGQVIPASGSLLPTWDRLLRVLSPSTTGLVRAISISRRANAIRWTRFSAGPSPQTPCGFSSMPSRTTEDGRAVVADHPAEKLIKIGAKVVSHARYVAFQMAEVAVSWQNILEMIARLRAPPTPHEAGFW